MMLCTMLDEKHGEERDEKYVAVHALTKLETAAMVTAWRKQQTIIII